MSPSPDDPAQDLLANPGARSARTPDAAAPSPHVASVDALRQLAAARQAAAQAAPAKPATSIEELRRRVSQIAPPAPAQAPAEAPLRVRGRNRPRAFSLRSVRSKPLAINQRGPTAGPA